MYLPFEDMPSTARVWIYQADRSLSTGEAEQIKEQATTFLQEWAAHGSPLKSSFKIFHDKFLMITVDESFNMASGCSIDASVALVRTLEKELSIDFFDRTKVCFLLNGEVFQSPMTDLKELITQGKIDEKSITFNNLVATLGEFKNNWKVAAEETWLKRYF
ncbi:MAG: hypothetical protein JXQ96_13905 [Cyclobacteriaceae bacterium]